MNGIDVRDYYAGCVLTAIIDRKIQQAMKEATGAGVWDGSFRDLFQETNAALGIQADKSALTMKIAHVVDCAIQEAVEQAFSIADYCIWKRGAR